MWNKLWYTNIQNYSVKYYKHFTNRFINHLYLLTFLLTAWSRVLLEKLTSSQLVKKFPIFYGTRRFITVFGSGHHLPLSWDRSVHASTSHCLNIYLNIILPSMPGSSKWSLSLMSPLQNPAYPTPLTIRATCPPISYFSIWSPEWYLILSTSLVV